VHFRLFESDIVASDGISATLLCTMVKIHFNETALRHIAQHRAADREGRLLYRTSKDSYRERWFRLCGNLLFYFRTNELGAVVDMSDPVGLLVLADCHVQTEEYGDRPFVFSVKFTGEENRKHFFSGQSQEQCVEWIQALRGCGHGELQSQMASLRLQIRQLTGRDPLSEKITIPKLPQSMSTGATLCESHGRRSPLMSSSAGPIMPTRPAPRRPTRSKQRLVQLVEPTAAAESAQVHAAVKKPETFSNWETFD